MEGTKVSSFNRSQVVNAINALDAEGATASADGLSKGVSELNAIPASIRSSLRVILLFSDGAPNIVNGQFRRANNSTVSVNLYSETSNSNICPISCWIRSATRRWRRGLAMAFCDRETGGLSDGSTTQSTDLPVTQFLS